MGGLLSHVFFCDCETHFYDIIRPKKPTHFYDIIHPKKPNSQINLIVIKILYCFQ